MGCSVRVLLGVRNGPFLVMRDCCCACMQEASQGSVKCEYILGHFFNLLGQQNGVQNPENRLSSMAEEKGLIVEEQGGFRKKRGCRDQLLSLVLLGQTEMVSKPAGMLVAFINFVKVYDNVDLEKLWSCLQSVGMNGRFLTFCMRGASAG